MLPTQGASCTASGSRPAAFGEQKMPLDAGAPAIMITDVGARCSQEKRAMTTTLIIVDADNSTLTRRINGVWVDASGRALDSHDSSSWQALVVGDLSEADVWPGARVVAEDVGALLAEISALKLSRKRANALYWARKRGGAS